MALYEFRCDSCQKTFEEIRKISERDLPANCSECHSPATRNLASRFAGFSSHKNDLPLNSNQLSNSEYPSSRLIKESFPFEYNGQQPPAVINMSNCVKSSAKGCTFDGVDRAIYAENADLDIEDMTFNNCRIGIEHMNSNIEMKNMKGKN